MKLIRFGKPGYEKPGVQLEDGKRIDVSLFGSDYNEQFFESNGLGKLKKWLESNQNDCPVVDENERLGPPVCRPSKLVLCRAY